MTNIPMPELGETITQGTITQWFKEVGSTVQSGEALFEVSTDKVDAEVPSPFSGTITKILFPSGQMVDVGAIVAEIDEGAGGASTPSTPAPQAAAAPALPATPEPMVATPEPMVATPAPVVEAPAPVPAPVAVAAEPVVTAVPAPVATVADQSPKLVTSPIVRRLMNDLGPDASLVTGTGPEGRVTRQDAEKVAFSPEHRNGASATPVIAPSSASAPSAAPATTRVAPLPAPEGADFVPFNKTRKITGERMVISKATSPHVMTAIEVDYERIEAVRRNVQAKWKRDEGFTLTYLPFIARALVEALVAFPYLNASVVEGGLALHSHIDLSIAVDLNFDGLLAPVIRKVEDLRMAAIARDIADLAARARSSKLQPNELSGGTFTISNSGPFGTFMVAPVINQPQVAILSTDGVTRKPVVITDEFGGESIAIHSVGMLVLSWDHRAFDGAYAAAFLRKLKEVLENHPWESEL
jgi:2-oxoglutarate dehydrogenase E2 component (dihydrolipoamide succinyltransferase)